MAKQGRPKGPTYQEVYELLDREPMLTLIQVAILAGVTKSRAQRIADNSGLTRVRRARRDAAEEQILREAEARDELSLEVT